MSDNDNSNVVVLDVETTLDLPLDRVLDGARDAQLTDCLVLGYNKNGFYMASTTVDGGKLLVLLERAKVHMIRRLEM